jgi:hypothetical protein
MNPLLLLAFAALALPAAPAHAALCEPGYFSFDGQDPCTPCSAGSYSDSPGATSCTDCGPHTVSAAGASACIECAYPYYQPEPGSSGCVRRNDYGCWTVRDLENPAAFTPMEDVAAGDEFSSEPVDLIRPSTICGSVSIESRFPGEHGDSTMCCYKADGVRPTEPVSVEATSQLGGTFQLGVVKRALVCDQCQGVAETEQTLQCWKVKDLKNPKFELIEGLRVGEEYWFGFILVKKPALLCAPASVDGSPLTDTKGHYCCYRAGKAYVSDFSENVLDPFGNPLTLGVSKRSVICEICDVSPLP